MDQPERRIHDQFLGIRLKMGRKLRELGFLLRSHADFHSLYARDENPVASSTTGRCRLTFAGA